jgi:hypothetical protein
MKRQNPRSIETAAHKPGLRPAPRKRPRRPEDGTTAFGNHRRQRKQSCRRRRLRRTQSAVADGNAGRDGSLPQSGQNDQRQCFELVVFGLRLEHPALSRLSPATDAPARRDRPRSAAAASQADGPCLIVAPTPAFYRGCARTPEQHRHSCNSPSREWQGLIPREYPQ